MENKSKMYDKMKEYFYIIYSQKLKVSNNGYGVTSVKKSKHAPSFISTKDQILRM